MDADRAAQIVLSEVEKLPAGSWTLSYDGPGRIDDPYADYLVVREICIEPVSSSGCPIEVWITSVGSIGLGFDTWKGLAARIGAKSSDNRFVFGFEPIDLNEKLVRSALDCVLLGAAEARYAKLGGRLLHATGRLTAQIGIPQIEKATWGWHFRYEPYAA